MMAEFSLQAVKVAIPSIQKARDAEGKAYYNYLVVVTVPSPFKRWKIERRFCQFFDLFKYFRGQRRIESPFPLPSITHFTFSKGKLAKLRVKKLEAFLVEVLGFTDLRVPEMQKLYSFLDIELLTDDSLGRDSDFGDVRKELFPDQYSAAGYSDYADRSTVNIYPIDPSTSKEGGSSDADCTDVIKLACSFSSEFRPTEDNSVDKLSSSDKALLAASSFYLEADKKERHYEVTAEGLKEGLRNNDVVAVQELLRKSKRLATEIDNAGNPMIYTAALYGAIELGIILISAGADPHTVNRQGISAMDIAFDPWRDAIQKFILKREQDRLNADICKYETIIVGIRKSNSGSIGLNIVRTTDNMPLVLGYKTDPALHETVDAVRAIVKPNDIICAVDGVEVKNLDSAVKMIKDAASNIELSLKRVVTK